MLYKCANPRCSILFRKMNEGRLFRLPQLRPAGGRNLRRTAVGLEYFWLCDQCQLSFTLAFCSDSEIVVVPAPRLPTRKLPQTVRQALVQQGAAPREAEWNA